jgi:hypothetical protein
MQSRVGVCGLDVGWNGDLTLMDEHREGSDESSKQIYSSFALENEKEEEEEETKTILRPSSISF